MKKVYDDSELALYNAVTACRQMIERGETTYDVAAELCASAFAVRDHQKVKELALAAVIGCKRLPK